MSYVVVAVTGCLSMMKKVIISYEYLSPLMVKSNKKQGRAKEEFESVLLLGRRIARRSPSW